MADLSADHMARIHAAAFPDSRGWSADEFTALAQSPHVFFVATADGFAAGRVIVDDAELLTIAVAPATQGQGVGHALLHLFERAAQSRGATRAFLEVAEDNARALALYRQAGWRESGRRAGYYARKTGKNLDALLFEKALNPGTGPEK